MDDVRLTGQTMADAPQEPQVHPLLHAGRWLLSDLLATLAFVGLYALSHNIYLATALGIGLGLGQIAWMKYKRADIDLLQWLSLGLVVVFSTATLITHNPVFVMLKPTFIYAAVGCVMLRPGWMNRYVRPIRQARSQDITFAFGYVWAGMMFATAAANLALALLVSVNTYVWFLGVFPLASKFVLVGIQYLTTRTIVRRRMRANALLPAGAAAE
jgi:intracellular septation protein A